MTQLTGCGSGDIFTFDPKDIIPILEDGIGVGELNRDIHKTLDHEVDYFKTDIRITQAERLLSFLRCNA
jgi:hypothetical protein